jgi:hypothetical protein
MSIYTGIKRHVPQSSLTTNQIRDPKPVAVCACVILFLGPINSAAEL